MNRFNLICYFNFFYSSCFTSNLENLFHSHSLLIYFSIYIVTSKRIFSILLFKRVLNSIGLCWFSVLCNSKLARYIYYRCSFDFFFSILQPRLPSKFARVVLCPFIIPVCHLLIQILVLFLVSFNVYATPSSSQLCSLSAFFFTYIL